MPLALDQAGAYIEETQCGLAGYQRLYQVRRTELLRSRGGLVADHPEPVATTWALSFEQVERRNTAAANLLRLCAFLAPDAIPEELLTQEEGELGNISAPVAADTYQFDQAVTALLAYSLVSRDSQTRALAVHRLVQVVIQNDLEVLQAKQYAERAVRLINSVFPDGEFANWQRCEQLVPHALVCANHIRERQLLSEEGAHLLSQVGEYLFRRARYEETLALFQQSLAIRKRVLPPNHPDLAESMNNVAIIYSRQRQYLEALPLYQQALAIWEQTLGPNHPLVALCLNNLAELHRLLEQYAQALPLYQRALSIQEQQAGPERPQLAHPLNGLANLYAEQGKYGEAEPLYQRALSIWERLLGPEHPDVIFALDGLANLYAKQDKYEEAEPLYQRALHIGEQKLGPEHPHVAQLLDELADLYAKQGR